jgi:hypothetical protein
MGEKVAHNHMPPADLSSRRRQRADRKPRVSLDMTRPICTLGR